ncbi:MAG TPA: glycosyltransferase family 2 protein [Verrucomicrobiae bacterium]|jgi:glycosyltransferase involved in cell wall biosynthesis
MTAESSLPISVCLISGSEAHRIRRALESVAGWTREIVIVLNEDVADGTDKVAAEFGAKIFREPWKGYAAQKNSAAKKARQEWILSLDADESVSPQLRAEIIETFAPGNLPSQNAAYSFPRCTLHCGRWIRHGDWYPDRKVRLWQRNRAEWRGQSVHETVVVDGEVGRLKNDLWHYSMESLDHQIRKSITYSNLFVQQRLESGSGAGLLELWFRPWWRFVRGYILRRGFLDGWQGYVIARMVAHETFLRYAKVRAAQSGPETKPLNDQP